MVPQVIRGLPAVLAPVGRNSYLFLSVAVRVPAMASTFLDHIPGKCDQCLPVLQGDPQKSHTSTPPAKGSIVSHPRGCWSRPDYPLCPSVLFGKKKHPVKGYIYQSSEGGRRPAMCEVCVRPLRILLKDRRARPCLAGEVCPVAGCLIVIFLSHKEASGSLPQA